MSMNNIHGVNLNNVYTKQQFEKKEAEEKKAQDAQVSPQQTEEVVPSSDTLMQALSLLSAQAKANIKSPEKVDPTKYLSEDRIADIEASMTKFEKDVEGIHAVLKSELPELDDSASMALAAETYAEFV